MSERAASAEQQAEAAIARHAQLQQVQRSQCPAASCAAVELASERLAPACRPSGWVRLAQAAVERRCDQEIDTGASSSTRRPAPGRSPASASPTTGSSSPARVPRRARPTGRRRGRFDPAQPVTLRFLRDRRRRRQRRGRLPLTHALVLGTRSSSFSVRPARSSPDASRSRRSAARFRERQRQLPRSSSAVRSRRPAPGAGSGRPGRGRCASSSRPPAGSPRGPRRRWPASSCEAIWKSA